MKPGCLQTDYRNMITVAMTWRFLRPRTAQLTKRAPLGGDSETRTPERPKRGDLDNPTCSPGKLERAAFPQCWPFPALVLPGAAPMQHLPLPSPPARPPPAWQLTKRALVGEISSDDITANIRVLPARQILVISDSCYSGALSRSSPVTETTPSADRIRLLESLRMRAPPKLLWARGGNEPVTDSGGSRSHSVFASALLRG